VIAIVWQFDVRPGSQTECERFFGADGEWTTANRHSRSYLGSSFLRDQSHTSRYLVVEYWSEMLVYEQAKIAPGRRIDNLDARLDELVVSTEPLGVFTALDVPERTGPTWSRRST